MAKPADPTALESLPSIGPSLARDLRDLGFRTPADLHGQDPEKMYEDLKEMRGGYMDRCVLYTFRCAVYAVTANDPDPELKKWWNWKDRTL